jgi:hypothetical protein
MTDTTATDRVVREAGGPAVLDRLVRIAGADLTTLLLRVLRLRAERLAPADVFRQYREDRFVVPAAVPFERLRATEDALISLLPKDFQLVTLSPVVPLGTHSVLGTVHQDKVLGTVRRSEVAADPTNGLALVAADLRRRARAEDGRSTDVLALATVQRVVRAQRFAGTASFAHFGLLAMVSAGRDTGNLAFERRYVPLHVRYLMDAVLALAGGAAELELTVADPRLAPVADEVRAELAGRSGVTVVDNPDRPAGRGYYAGLCFKVFAVHGSERLDLGDGGLVDWTARLLGNRKERLVTSAIGLDRLALM